MIPPAQNPYYASLGLQTSAQYSDYSSSPSEEMTYSNERRVEDDEYYDEMEKQQMRGYEEQPEEEYEEEYEDENNFDSDEYDSHPSQNYDEMGFSNDIISGELINYDSPYSHNSFDDRKIIATDGNMGNYWSMDNLIGDLQGFQKGGNKSSVDASFGLPEDVFGAGTFKRQSVSVQSQSFNDIFGGQEMYVDPQTMYGLKDTVGNLVKKGGKFVANVKNIPTEIAEKWHEGKGDLDTWKAKKENKSNKTENSPQVGADIDSNTTNTPQQNTIVHQTSNTKSPDLEKAEKKMKEQEEEIEKLKRNNRDAYLQSRRHLGFSLNSMDDDDDYLSMRSRLGGYGSTGGIEIGMKERSGEDLFGKIGGSESDDEDTTTIQGETDLIGFKSAKPASSSSEKAEMIQGDVFGFKGMGNYGEAEDMFGKSLNGRSAQGFGDIFGNFGGDNQSGGRPMGFSEIFGFSIGSQSDNVPTSNPNVRTSLTSLNVKNENKKQFNKIVNTPSTGVKRKFIPKQQNRQNNNNMQQIPQQQIIPQKQEMNGYMRNFFNNNEDYTERFAMTDSTYAFDVGGNLGFDYSNQSPDILGVSGMIGLGDSRVTVYNPKTKTMTITTKKSGKTHKSTKKLNKKNTKCKKSTHKKTSSKKINKKQNIKSEKDNDIIRDLIWG